MAQDEPRPRTEGAPQTPEDAQAHAPAGGAEPPAAGATPPADETAPAGREQAEAAATAEDAVQAARQAAEAAVAQAEEAMAERDEAVSRAERAEQEAQHAQAAAERAQRERDNARAGQQTADQRREQADRAAERPPEGDAVVEEIFLDERDILTRPVAQRGVLGRLVSEEAVRAGIALLLFVLLAAVILVAFLQAESWDQTKQLLDAVLPTVTALLGSAIGFYFGTRVIR